TAECRLAAAARCASPPLLRVDCRERCRALDRGNGGSSLHDWFFRHGGGRKRVIDWLGIDAWIDSSLAQTWQSLQDRWNAFSSFFARFRLAGWRRLLNEAIAEGLTLGLGRSTVLYLLPIPPST